MSLQNDKILLIEDSLAMQITVEATVAEICGLTVVSTLADARKALGNTEYSLIVLDVNLPDGDGFAFCKELREQSRFQNLPIVFLTGQTDVEDRVKGFSLGADDYIVKPFEPKEFMARIISKLKRKPKGTPEREFRKSVFRVDLTGQRAHLLTTEGTEEPMNLTPIEFKLLVHFLTHEGMIFSREDLLKAIWGASTHVSGHTVDTHISGLRKKLGYKATDLKAVTKQGYRFVTENS